MPSSITMSKLRLGDVHANTENNQKLEACPLCSQEPSSWVKHIIIDCDSLEALRSRLGIKLEMEEKRRAGIGEELILEEMLENTGLHNRKRLHALLSKWNEHKK